VYNVQDQDCTTSFTFNRKKPGFTKICFKLVSSASEAESEDDVPRRKSRSSASLSSPSIDSIPPPLPEVPTLQEQEAAEEGDDVSTEEEMPVCCFA